MDVKLQEITLPHFLWYIIPGLNFIAVDLFLPIFLMEPSLLKNIASIGGIVIIFLCALVSGFIMDSLKLYQFTVGYAERKEKGFKKLSDELGLDRRTTKLIFDAIRIGLADRGPLGKAVAFDHSRWVMINHTSKCFYLFAIIWSVIRVSAVFTQIVPFYEEALGVKGLWAPLIFNAFILAIAVLIAMRLSKIAAKHHRSNGDKYVLYVKRHKQDILHEVIGKDTRKNAF
jgi:hypothetical protein